jgi:hypothetical protein
MELVNLEPKNHEGEKIGPSHSSEATFQKEWISTVKVEKDYHSGLEEPVVFPLMIPAGRISHVR